ERDRLRTWPLRSSSGATPDVVRGLLRAAPRPRPDRRPTRPAESRPLRGPPLTSLGARSSFLGCYRSLERVQARMDETFGRGPLLLLSGRANRPLAAEIAALLDQSVDGAFIRDFADGEIFVRIDRNARGRDVFIIQPTISPADNIMELLLLIDAAKRASAARVTA